MLAFARRHGPLIALLALAATLRLPWLGAIPNPAGDEGNWAWFGHRIVLGWPVELHPDARFVTLAFAHLIALSYRIFGASFAAARGVLVAGILLAMVLAWGACSRLGLRRAGVAILALLAVHPWAVLWSRTVTVPYALVLAVGVAGPLCLLAALRARSTVGIVLSVQVLSVGVQFSPLALIAMAACGLWVLRPGVRAQVSWRVLLVAGVLGAVHLVPVVLGAASVAGRGTTRPSHYLDHFGTRLHTFVGAVFGGLGGEATVRHFTGDVLPRPLEALVIVGVLATLAFAWPRARDGFERDTPAWNLSRYAALHLLVALVGLPLILAPARPWNLPAIDADRYLFTVLCPAVLCVGALAERARGRWLAVAVIVYLALGPTRRLAMSFLFGGSPDHGFYVMEGGGGYRGWKVPRERIAAEVIVRDEALAVAHGQRTTVVMGDYAFHPLHFVDEATRLVTTDLCKYPLTVHAGDHYVFVTYSQGLFAPGFRPVEWERCNQTLIDRMRGTDFVGLRRLRTVVQANGAPFFEVHTADGAR